MTARKVDDHVELDEDDARAGQTGMHVRYISHGVRRDGVLSMWMVSLLH